ncbi:TipAS antibiotic-recognition domain-containing protein [Microbacterium sp. MYb64]|uniref:MerR family transcriptional regulator n=1 Tax=Microbacterium sp. MYb64 TaxID=1848691 RepID=UPI000CFAEB68|nr:TipAS antibiotic-recognition domain-containing protein [Microbacterium sp. MYb64]PRB02107.1 MerR family transcriptional regulator [Microbacterium sp. MYb64]
MTNRDWSIQEIARLTGTTSRTLRHYDDIGLLPPTRVAANGYRHYDQGALLRLQRILLLRELGLGLPAIAEVVGAPGAVRSPGPVAEPPEAAAAPGADRKAGASIEAAALEKHLALLRAEQTRLARQIASVENTITTLREGGALMPDDMFDGFDHTQYKDEVESRWGTKAYADSDRWWRGLGAEGQNAWKAVVADLNRSWIALAEAGTDPASPEAQDVARRHVDWLTGIPGTPAYGAAGDRKAYVIGLGEMYVADPRFGANYATDADRAAAAGSGTAGTVGAEFVRDALRIYAEGNL